MSSPTYVYELALQDGPIEPAADVPELAPDEQAELERAQADGRALPWMTENLRPYLPPLPELPAPY